MRVILSNGYTIVPETITLSHGEGDAMWAATLSLTEAAHYAALPLDADITVELGGTVWNLVVHARDRQADGDGGWRYTVEAVSPIVRLSDRYSKRIDLNYSSPAMASKVVSNLLPGITIHWNMIDWAIPAERLTADKAVPLEMARRIVEATGGVLESAPDGAVTARPAFPVSVPSLPAAPADHVIDDLHDITGLRETLTVERIVNKLTIADSQAALSQGDTANNNGSQASPYTADQLSANIRDKSYVADVTAIPDPWRPVTIEVSAGAGTVSQAAVTTVLVDEVISVEDGRGSLSYPTAGDPVLTWIGKQSSQVTLEDDRRTLTLDVGLYTLVRAQYHYNAYTAVLSAPGPGATQVVLRDTTTGRITAATVVDFPAKGLDSQATATDGRQIPWHGDIVIEKLNAFRPIIAVAPTPDKLIASQGWLEFMGSVVSDYYAEYLTFNGNRSASLPWPDVPEAEIVETIKFLKADGSPADNVTFRFDPDSHSVIASDAVYAAVRVRYRRRFDKYAVHLPAQSLPGGGVSVEGVLVLALKGASATSLYIDPPTMVDVFRKVEVLRVISKAVVDPNGVWEHPPGFPSKTWADYGYDGTKLGYPTKEFPDTSNHLVIERTHALVEAELDNGTWVLRDSYQTVKLETPQEPWRLEVKWASLDEEAFKNDAYTDIGRVLDTLKGRLGYDIDLKLTEMPPQLKSYL